MSKSMIGVSLVTAAIGAFSLPLAAEAATDPRIDAFRATCVPDRQNYEALKLRALEQGWAPVRAGVNDELDAMLGRSAETVFEPGMDASLASYAATVAGGEAYLVLTSVTGEPIDLVGCYLYDFAANVPIEPDIVTEWLGAPPTDAINEPAVIVGYTWETPASLPGTWDVYLAFLPEGGGASEFAGFSGVLIKITSVEPKEE